MGLYTACYSTSDGTGSVERAVLELYDEASARATAPGMDDVLGQPYLVDSDNDGLGNRVRPGVIHTLRAKARWVTHERQVQDGAGAAGESLLVLTMYEADLESAGLLVNGVCEIAPNDRLLRLESPAGAIRVDFTYGGREGLFCREVRPGETGEGTYMLLFEKRTLTGR